MIQEKNKSSCDCNTSKPIREKETPSLEMLPIFQGPVQDNDEPCCGPPAGPASSEHERPGYVLCDFVDGFISTPVGQVPKISNNLARRDHWGALKVRLGIGRNNYKVAPGLYALGSPDAAAPVLVTANYKLTFDHLRKHVSGTSAWVLVLDTRGINVWCAAGKGTFGTQEVIQRVQTAQLSKVVQHRKIILPQLGAPGVAAKKVKKGCGFEVVWGPVRAQDLPDFIVAGFKANQSMRRVTFTAVERLVLVPVELSLMRTYLLWAMLAIFVLSGIGTHWFSFQQALARGFLAAVLCLVGIVAGCAVVPLLLPWIPGRAFAFKGALAGLVASGLALLVWPVSDYLSFWPAVALVLFATAISSYGAMNFTGTTPFTSPTGVEKEMRQAIPLQLGAVAVSVVLWVGSGFYVA